MIIMANLLLGTCGVLRTRFNTIKNIAGTQQARIFFWKRWKSRASSKKFPRNPHRPHSVCDTELCPPCVRPCFDITAMIVERPSSKKHEDMIRNFLIKNYWPREPSIGATYMPYASEYIRIQTDKFTTSGDRFMAFECDACCQKRLIGVLSAHKVMPWMVCELEEWARFCQEPAERNHLFFLSHCHRQANLHAAYNTSVLLDLSVVATTPDVQGQGVATCLIRNGLKTAGEWSYPITVVATNAYLQRAIARIEGMNEVWSMRYEKYLDRFGNQVFCPLRPHERVAVYGRPV